MDIHQISSSAYNSALCNLVETHAQFAPVRFILFQVGRPITFNNFPAKNSAFWLYEAMSAPSASGPQEPMRFITF